MDLVKESLRKRIAGLRIEASKYRVSAKQLDDEAQELRDRADSALLEADELERVIKVVYEGPVGFRVNTSGAIQ
jgi:uncharacterized coiled-coil DUF342 family protein